MEMSSKKVYQEICKLNTVAFAYGDIMLLTLNNVVEYKRSLLKFLLAAKLSPNWKNKNLLEEFFFYIF